MSGLSFSFVDSVLGQVEYVGGLKTKTGSWLSSGETAILAFWKSKKIGGR